MLDETSKSNLEYDGLINLVTELPTLKNLVECPKLNKFHAVSEKVNSFPGKPFWTFKVQELKFELQPTS